MQKQFKLPVSYSGKRVLSHTHKALVFGDSLETYAKDVVPDLISAGFLVKLTSLSSFTKNVDKFIEENYDLLVFDMRSCGIPYTANNISANDALQALLKWRTSGKKIIFYTLGNTSGHVITKYNSDGTTEYSPLSEVLPVSIAAVIIDNVENRSFEHSTSYPFGDNEVIDEFKPIGSVRHFTALESGAVVAVNATDGTHTASIVVYKPDDYCLIGYGGSSDIATFPGYRYIKAGIVAKHLIGLSEESLSLALDCKYNKKIAASGIDCDITDEKNAVMPYVEAYNGKPLELGVVTSKLTDSLASWYRHLGVEINSHSMHHHATITNAIQTVTIPDSLVIQIEYPYKLTLTSIVVDGLAYTSGVGVLPTSKYQFSITGYVRFSAEDVGKVATISYTHSLEPDEWIGSLLALENFKCMTNKSIYLTGGETSVHPATMLYLERLGYIVCDHIEAITRASYLFGGKIYTDKLTPWLAPTFRISQGVGGFDTLFEKDEITAKELELPAKINFCKKWNLPFLWYSHDFIFSQTAYNRIWGDPDNRWHDDWGLGTYEECVAKVKSMIEYALTKLDEENVYWMVRSDYHRWFKSMVEGIRYSVEVKGPIAELLVRNESDKTLSGLTFRMYSDIEPKGITIYPNINLEYTYANGEVLFNFDILPGEDLLIKVVR